MVRDCLASRSPCSSEGLRDGKDPESILAFRYAEMDLPEDMEAAKRDAVMDKLTTKTIFSLATCDADLKALAEEHPGADNAEVALAALAGLPGAEPEVQAAVGRADDLQLELLADDIFAEVFGNDSDTVLRNVLQASGAVSPAMGDAQRADADELN